MSEDRVSTTADEIVNVFPTPWGDHREAKAHVNHLCRSTLCTYTQGEKDDVITAHGPVHLKGYAFQGKWFGQLEPCEWVWRPNANGWQKRLSISISPDKNPMDEDACAVYSHGLWQSLHDNQLEGPFRQPVQLHLDEYARPFFRVAKRAIDDWLLHKSENFDKVSILRLS